MEPRKYSPLNAPARNAPPEACRRALFGSRLRVVVVGGDGRNDLSGEGRRVTAYPSSRFGGNGCLEGARAAIRAGVVDVVVVLVRWIGHAEYHALVRTCGSAGVPLLIARGGASSARRDLNAFLGGC